MTLLVPRDETAVEELRREKLADGAWPWTVAAALLLHAAVLLLCILDWQGVFATARYEPPAIPVTLVYEPPPPPPAPPVKPARQTPPITPRASGADEKTEAVATEKPQPALPKSKPETETTDSKQPKPARTGEKAPAAAKRQARTGEQQAAIALDPHKEAQVGQIFHEIRLPSSHGGNSSRDLAGDAYLNRLHDIVERNRIYPPRDVFGGDSERVALYSIVIDPGGNLVAITLLQSTGSPTLDEAAGRMLRVSAPFPPIPPSYPQIRTLITVEMPIYPTPR